MWCGNRRRAVNDLVAEKGPAYTRFKLSWIQGIAFFYDFHFLMEWTNKVKHLFGLFSELEMGHI